MTKQATRVREPLGVDASGKAARRGRPPSPNTCWHAVTPVAVRSSGLA